jgi:hypothetical protein
MNNTIPIVLEMTGALLTAALSLKNYRDGYYLLAGTGAIVSAFAVWLAFDIAKMS